MSWEYEKMVSEKSTLKLKRGDSLHQNQSEVVAVNQPLAQKWLLCVNGDGDSSVVRAPDS